jgi:predicted RNase H-like HicB family nuclease
MKVVVIIEKGIDGTFDACMEYYENLSFGLLGQGDTVEEAIEDFYKTRDEMKLHYQETGKYFPEDLEFEFKYDTASFLSYYSKTLSLGRIGTYYRSKSRSIKSLCYRSQKTAQRYCQKNRKIVA